MANMREECGVLGIYRNQRANLAMDCYLGLCALQHRGQESCGIAVNEDGLFRFHLDAGLVSEVMTDSILQELGGGQIAVGHVRYGSDDNRGRINMQPLVINHRKGRLALANNGELTNYSKLREEFENQGMVFHSTGDAEVISCAITRERLTAGSTEEALETAKDSLDGSYTLVMMTPKKLIAARGPRAFRPLCFGRLPEGGFWRKFICKSQALAAESDAIFEIQPGKMLPG